MYRANPPGGCQVLLIAPVGQWAMAVSQGVLQKRGGDVRGEAGYLGAQCRTQQALPCHTALRLANDNRHGNHRYQQQQPPDSRQNRRTAAPSWSNRQQQLPLRRPHRPRTPRDNTQTSTHTH